MRVLGKLTVAVSLSTLVVTSLPGQVMPILPDMNAATADPAVKIPEYDVSTVKLHKGDDRMMRVATKDDSYSASNLPLTTLISFSYNSRPDLISGGPSWLVSIHKLTSSPGALICHPWIITHR